MEILNMKKENEEAKKEKKNETGEQRISNSKANIHEDGRSR